MAMRQIGIAGVILTVAAIVSTALVALTFDATRDEIAANEQAALKRQLNQVLPAHAYTNDITGDTTLVTAPAVLGTAEPVLVYRARKDGEPAGVVMTVIAPDGYSGPIKLLVGIYADGTLAGVRVVSHKETPGLGDAIEAGRSNWIRAFEGKSLDDPTERGWAVKKDGGEFDQFTGATITPRAVVEAVQRTLAYFRDNQAALFESGGDSPQPSSRKPDTRPRIPPQTGEANG